MPYVLPVPLTKFDRNFSYWKGGFTPQELKDIIQLGESMPKVRGQIGSGAMDEELLEQRNNFIAWIPCNQDTAWLHKKLANFVIDLNAKYFGFDLTGFTEDLQYTVYNSDNGPEHYDWHIDSAANGSIPRKLSLTLQLSDPMEYEGGEVWIHGLTRCVLPKEQGTLTIFPSYALHRVTPVTKGVRRSLVAWISGPEFR